MAAHFRPPSFWRKVSWASNQSKLASRRRPLPFLVISIVRLRRQPSLPTRMSPSLSRGARFRVSVDRSIPMSLASAVIETASPLLTATSTPSWVARSPTDRNASSYKRVTARAAIRVRWHMQFWRISCSVTIDVIPVMMCIYTTPPEQSSCSGFARLQRTSHAAGKTSIETGGRGKNRRLVSRRARDARQAACLERFSASSAPASTMTRSRFDALASHITCETMLPDFSNAAASDSN